MKTVAAVTLLFVTALGFGQTVVNDRVVTKFTLDYRPAIIELTKHKNSISSIRTPGGKIILGGLPPGYYSFIISGDGQLTKRTDSTLIKEGQLLELDVTFSGLCLYDHPAEYIPMCPESHTDNIIPIVYGLVGATSGSKKMRFIWEVAQ